MNTTSFTVALSEALRPFVEQQVAGTGHDSPAAYIEALILAEQQRQEDKRMESLLLAGMGSPMSPLTRDDVEGAFRRALQRSGLSDES